MRYRQFAPPPDLAPYVECAWRLEGDLAPEGEMILPDGRLELVFHLGAAPRDVSGVQPSTMVAGRMRCGLELRGCGVCAIGLRLRPATAGCLLPLAEIGPVEDLRALSSGWGDVGERLGNESSLAGQLELLWSAVRWRLVGRQADAMVDDSVRRIEAAYGCGPVELFMPDGIAYGNGRGVLFAPPASCRKRSHA